MKKKSTDEILKKCEEMRGKCKLSLREIKRHHRVDLELMKSYLDNAPDTSYRYYGEKFFSAKNIEPILDAIGRWMTQKTTLSENFAEEFK